MRTRSLLGMLLLTLITAGLYQIYWLYSTKEEMRAKGSRIPTILLLLVPLVNIWWFWRYARGVAEVTRHEDHRLLTFVLLVFANGVAPFVTQWSFNRLRPQPPLLARAVAREVR